MKIAVIVAMQSEFDLVSHVISGGAAGEVAGIPCLEGAMFGHSVTLLKCGIGKVNSAIQASALIQAQAPDFVINTGVAGGLGRGMRPGDVVIADRCAYHDVWCGEGEWGQVQGMPLYFRSDGRLLAAAGRISAGRVTVGLICSGDQFVSDPAQLAEIRRRFPDAQAVDMESCSIAHACHLARTPYISLRVVSDTPGMEADNTAQYFDFMTDAPRRTFQVLEQLVRNI